MKEIVLQKGTFIVVPHGTPHLNENEIIGLVSEILKDEELSKKFSNRSGGSSLYWIDHNTNQYYTTAIRAFQSLCTKYELKETDLLIKKI